MRSIDTFRSTFGVLFATLATGLPAAINPSLFEKDSHWRWAIPGGVFLVSVVLLPRLATLLLGSAWVRRLLCGRHGIEGVWVIDSYQSGRHARSSVVIVELVAPTFEPVATPAVSRRVLRTRTTPGWPRASSRCGDTLRSTTPARSSI